MANHTKLSILADQIMKALNHLDPHDPQALRVRAHVLALADAMGADIPDTAVGLPTERPRGSTPDERVQEVRELTEQARNHTITQERELERRIRGFAPSSFPPAKRPGLATERRAARQLAGVTLKGVAQAAGTTLPTVRMYEAKRTAVRPDKRAILDHVYAEFQPKREPTK